MYSYYNVLRLPQFYILPTTGLCFSRSQTCDLGISGLAVGMMQFFSFGHVDNGIIKNDILYVFISTFCNTMQS